MKAKEFLNQLKSLHEQMPYPAILFGDKIDNGKIVKTHWFAMFVDPKLDLVEIGLHTKRGGDADLIDLIAQLEEIITKHPNAKIGFKDSVGEGMFQTYFSKLWFDRQNNAIEMLFNTSESESVLDSIGLVELITVQ